MLKYFLLFCLLISLTGNGFLYFQWRKSQQIITQQPQQRHHKVERVTSADLIQAFQQQRFKQAFNGISQLTASEALATQQSWFLWSQKWLEQSNWDALHKMLQQAEQSELTQQKWVLRINLRYTLAQFQFESAAELIYGDLKTGLNETEYQLEWHVFEQAILDEFSRIRQSGAWQQGLTLFETLYWYQDDYAKFSLALAEIYFQLGEINQAEQILLYVEADPEFAEQAVALRLRMKNKEVTIALKKHAAHYWVKVQIDQTPVQLMLDTGATMTSLSRTFVEQNSLEYRHVDYQVVQTANGETQAEQIEVDRFAMGGVVLNNFRMLVLDNYFSKNDGLLGMNFLSNFEFYIDQERDQLRLNVRNSDKL